MLALLYHQYTSVYVNEKSLSGKVNHTIDCKGRSSNMVMKTFDIKNKATHDHMETIAQVKLLWSG